MKLDCSGCGRFGVDVTMYFAGEVEARCYCEDCMVVFAAKLVRDAAARGGYIVPAWLDMMRTPSGYRALMSEDTVRS